MPVRDPATYFPYYREKNRLRLREYKKRFYHEKNGKEKSVEYYKRTIEERRSASREKNNRNRKQLLYLLGGQCCICNFSDWRALQIDHIYGGGAYERRGYGHSASALRNRVIDDLTKTAGERRYQLLCANCNWIKRHESKELFWDKRIKA